MIEQYCNKCGKKLDLWDKQENFSINRHLGYGTKYDGCVMRLSLCCDCMEQLVDSCALFPISDLQ